MIALSLLKPFAKPILALLIGIFAYYIFQYHNALQQKIGQLDQQLIEKQQQFEKQDQSYQEIRTQILKQSVAITDLQKAQEDLQNQTEIRQVTLKEIFNHDEIAKSWASQPVPHSIRRMYNNTATGQSTITLPIAQ